MGKIHKVIALASQAFVKKYVADNAGTRLEWTNDNPSVAFDKQKISLDLSERKRVTIVFRLYNNTATTMSFDYPVDGEKYYATIIYNSRSVRGFTITSDGIEFESGYYSNLVDGTVEVDNKGAIPLKIYSGY